MIKVLLVGGNKQGIPQLSGTDINVDYVQNGMIALSAVQTQDFDIIIIEDQLPLMTPMRLIKELISIDSTVPVIGLIRSEEASMNLLNNFGVGLFGCIEPESYSNEEVLLLLHSAKRFHDFLKGVPKISRRHFSSIGFKNIVGVSQSMLDLYHLLNQIKSKNVTTVLYGESGTGKNLIAKTLHQISLRRDRPNISVNCPAIPSELLESELFGHEKGAFTGAIERKDGKFLIANSGTIFLDEIGDMSPSLQAKILRVLESGEIERVGGAETIKVDVRIISATNQDLEQRIKDGKFRQDLFHRINVFPMRISPLRDRKEDIPVTAMTILKGLKKKHNIVTSCISHNGMKALQSYDWPGNVRELENTLERIVLINDSPIITKEEVMPILDESSQPHDAQTLPESPPPSSAPAETSVSSSEDQRPAEEQIHSINTSAIKTLKELEYEVIQAGLSRTNWNMTLTAQQLGISRMTLYRKLDQHGLRKKD
jgi:DNA-binding NtrC family response regulator